MSDYESAMLAWVEDIRKHIRPLEVPETHRPTANERNNVVHLCFRHFFGHSFRLSDLATVEGLAPEIADLPDLRSRYIPALAEYIWDHWMGEPEEISTETVTAVCRTIADILFTLDEDVRNDIETKG